MKTSNKLLLTAIMVVIISMVTYDFALRAEYVKGEYKNRFYGKENLGFKGFKSVDNRAANYVGVTIERGDKFEVWADKNSKEQFKISVVNGQLIVDVADRKSPKINPYSNSITVICPVVNRVTTQSLLLVNEDHEIYPSDATTNLTGFDLQNLSLIIEEATHLNLEHSRIENLNAVVGNDHSKHAYLFIATNNQIGNASINVIGKNQFSTGNPKINKVNFIISDSANVNISGSILKQLRSQQK